MAAGSTTATRRAAVPPGTHHPAGFRSVQQTKRHDEGLGPLVLDELPRLVCRRDVGDDDPRPSLAR
jgi:hypothetical protein